MIMYLLYLPFLEISSPKWQHKLQIKNKKNDVALLTSYIGQLCVWLICYRVGVSVSMFL